MEGKMPHTINVLSDRLLSMFVPKAKAGACACGPAFNGWYFYCKENQRWKAYCTFTCSCNQTCVLHTNTGEDCDLG